MNKYWETGFAVSFQLMLIMLRQARFPFLDSKRKVMLMTPGSDLPLHPANAQKFDEVTFGEPVSGSLEVL
jgi:hypothetical protein